MAQKYVNIFNCLDGQNECTIKNKQDDTIYTYKCKDNQYDGNVKESINLKNVKKNMFIDLCNRGRFGNYIYGAIFTVMALIQFEIFLRGKNPNYKEIEQLLKNDKLNSKLYSAYNCTIENDEQSGIEDKYYYLKSGVDAFKYFDCYHFDREKLICDNNVDLILEYESSVRVYINDGIYICFNLLKLRNINVIFGVDGSDIKTENIRNFCNFEDIMEKLQSILSTNPVNVINLKNISNISEKINYIKQHNVNILKDCFVEEKQSKIIAYFDDSKIIAYFDDLVSDNSSTVIYECAFDININYLNTIKNILFEDTNQNVQNLYSLYKSKNIDTILTIIHFRGGDFERIVKDWYVLNPKYYVDAINILIQKIGVDKKIKLLCSYHPSDVIFGGYVNIIKHNFSNIEVMTENDFISEYPDAKYIFMNETKHILFMSMFPNMILSNSTYAQIASDINVNLDKILVGTNKLCYGSAQNYKYCGMNGIYTWDVMYKLFYHLYRMTKNGIIVYGEKHYFVNMKEIENDNPIANKDIDEFAIHIVNMGKNFITLLINGKKINAKFDKDPVFSKQNNATSDKRPSFSSKPVPISYKTYYIVEEHVLTGGNMQRKILKYNQKLSFLTNMLH